MVSSKTKFEWGPLDRGLNICWGGLRLCQTVVTDGYILTHDVILLPAARANDRLAVCSINTRSLYTDISCRRRVDRTPATADSGR